MLVASDADDPLRPLAHQQSMHAVLSKCRCHICRVTLTWDATVAKAAPRQPQSTVKMSRGASITLMALHAKVPQRGVLVSPSPLYTPYSRTGTCSQGHVLQVHSPAPRLLCPRAAYCTSNARGSYNIPGSSWPLRRGALLRQLLQQPTPTEQNSASDSVCNTVLTTHCGSSRRGEAAPV